MSNIVIKEVVSKKDLNTFIKFPDQLYKGNKFRVPQLHTFEKSTLMKEIIFLRIILLMALELEVI